MNTTPVLSFGKAALFLLSTFLILICHTARAGDKPGYADSRTAKTASLSAFKPFGKWRGEFQMKDSVRVPFNFEITGNTPQNARAIFINGPERFDGGGVSWTNDSLFIHLDQFDNELALAIDKPVANGVLRRQDLTGNPTKLTAEKGVTYRFAPGTRKNTILLHGTYDINFKTADGTDDKAVGVFEHRNSKITGTFLRITGDSRYLEGIESGNRFYLSSFIGSGPVYYTGTINPDGSISGARGQSLFTGVPNEEAALPDAYKLTFLKDGYNTINFSFPDLKGNQVSPTDAKYRDKVLILTIGGTWCPNCMDEANFLAPWYKKNRDRGVEIIALHYERTADTAYVRKMITRFNQKFDIRYDEVFAGIADKQAVSNSLPALNNFLSFPTTIILDKTGKVAKIHTGFSGPATGKYYDEFVEEFNRDVDELLAK